MFQGLATLGVLEGVPLVKLNPSVSAINELPVQFACLKQLIVVSKKELQANKLCLHDIT